MALALVTGCDGDQSVFGSEASASDLVGRQFEFSEGAPFGLASPILVAFPPSTSSQDFTLRSLANGDQARGTVRVPPCAFEAKMVSLPANAILRVGAELQLACAFDPVLTALRLMDPRSGVSITSRSCAKVPVEEGDDAGPCT